MSQLLLTHAVVTWALVGLIWTVQVVIYPLFDRIGPDTFQAYHASYTRRITWVVAPLMIIEVVTAALLIVRGPVNGWIGVSVPLLLLIWLSTAFVQVPLHGRLTQGFDAETHRRLVASNWWRTAAWSLRGVSVWMALWA